MVLKATIYKATVNITNMDRHFSTTIPRWIWHSILLKYHST